MTLPNAWGALDWWIPVVVIAAISVLLVIWTASSSRTGSTRSLLMIALKTAALLLLATCLLEPLHRYQVPEPGANTLSILVDDSQSLKIADQGSQQTREQQLYARIQPDQPWLRSLDEQFEIRNYQFDSRLRPVNDFADYSADQTGTTILDCLETIHQRMSNRPAAGIVLMTDGNSSDSDKLDQSEWLDDLPPIYPIVAGNSKPPRDILVARANASQTNFESAPVTITAEVIADGYAGQVVDVHLIDGKGKSVEKKEIRRIEDSRPFAVRFQLKPENRGINVFHVKAVPGGVDPSQAGSSGEATLLNNQRTVVVDRGRGPFRILYVAGRPNWEYKFLRRALTDDYEIQLVGLLRVARREPKFSFRSRDGEKTNPLFRGFGNQLDATAEQYDEPVLIRLDTADAEELSDGFPKEATSLFKYDALILDDVEADFFDEDQKSLVQQFVSQRGGGFLMLGGLESFAGGRYDRTPIGEILPVYLDRIAADGAPANFRLQLTRDGWVQPWVRIQSTRQTDEQRLAEMPSFKTTNLVRAIKPGATVLATVRRSDDSLYPALVTQPFGRGQCAAILIGDLWRWQMNSPPDNDDLAKSWRQTIRWLVSNVPRRVEINTKRLDSVGERIQITIDVNEMDFKPMLNAEIDLEITKPDGQAVKLRPEQSSEQAGRYSTVFMSRDTGAFKVKASVQSADGSSSESRESGWACDPQVEEFQNLTPDRRFLEQLAQRTGGEVIELNQLNQFANSFENRTVPIQKTLTRPWWHRWPILVIALSLLIAEWGLRRYSGLA